MIRRWLLVVIGVNLVALAALVFIYPHLMVAPGPLVTEHSALTSDCFACHSPLRGVTSARCAACHVAADIGVRTTKGVVLAPAAGKVRFHQALVEQNCMACHTDHKGPKFAPAIGKGFSHLLFRSDLRDDCTACHTKPTGNLHRQISGNCRQCHDQKAWKPATFNHDKSFLLDGDHKAPCATCHESDDYSRYTCYGCHEHHPAKIKAKHVKEGITNFENCVECHRSASEEKSERGNSRKKKRD